MILDEIHTRERTGILRDWMVIDTSTEDSPR